MRHGRCALSGKVSYDLGFIPELGHQGGNVWHLDTGTALGRLADFEGLDARRDVDPKVFGFEDVELEIEPTALRAIADLALTRGTGARGLRSILEDVLLNTMYEVPGMGDVAKVVVTESSVIEKTAPLIVMRGSSKAPRQRRAAS